MPRIYPNIKDRAHRLCSGCDNVPEGHGCPACGKLAVHDWNDKPQSFWSRHTNIICCDHCQVSITCTIEYGRGITLALASPGPAPDAAVFGPDSGTVKQTPDGWVTVRGGIESDCPFPTAEAAHQALADMIQDDHVTAGHYHDPSGTYDYCTDPRCPRVRTTP